MHPCKLMHAQTTITATKHMQTIRQPRPHLAFHDFRLTRATDTCRGDKIVDCSYCIWKVHLQQIPKQLWHNQHRSQPIYTLHSECFTPFENIIKFENPSSGYLPFLAIISYMFLHLNWSSAVIHSMDWTWFVRDNCQCKVSWMTKCNRVQ